MRLAIAQPWSDPSANALRIRRSSVPCRRSTFESAIRASYYVIRQYSVSRIVGCQGMIRAWHLGTRSDEGPRPWRPEVLHCARDGPSRSPRTSVRDQLLLALLRVLLDH